ncbi:MAG: hypothetical protein GOU97_04925 [Nanoarchaeota archaeon]|nr:hypothetical protein [Nanoarchaeota archaeon]
MEKTGGLKQEILSVIKSKDKGRGISFKIVKKYVSAKKNVFNNALDELIDDGLVKEIEGGRLKVVGEIPQDPEEVAPKQVIEKKEEVVEKTPLKKFFGVVTTLLSWLIATGLFFIFLSLIDSGRPIPSLITILLTLFWAPPMKRVIPGVGKNFWFKLLVTLIILSAVSFTTISPRSSDSKLIVPSENLPISAESSSKVSADYKVVSVSAPQKECSPEQIKYCDNLGLKAVPEKDCRCL